MDSKRQCSRLQRLALVGVLVVFGALTAACPVYATENYLSLWRSTYPDSASADNLESACTLCHAGSSSEFNGYGWDFRQYGFDFIAIESLNSDGDPNYFGNLEEINADTQPGWTDGANNLINGGEVSGSATPAEIIAGTLDPGIGTVTITLGSDWGSGFQSEVVITNNSSDTIGWWSVTFDADFTIDQIWHGQIVSHTGDTYVVKGYDWNNAIAPGAQVSFGFNASPGGSQLPEEFSLVDLSRSDNDGDSGGDGDSEGDGDSDGE
jgi:cellulase/cellobiase CelA1